MEELKAGKILLSEPFIDDPTFSRSVLFLTEHNEKGSHAFVINKWLDVKIHEIFEDLPEFNADVFRGGPVEKSTLHFLHRIADLPDSREVIPGVYWGGDFEELKERIRNKKLFANQVKFFVGYTGWYPEQLEEEMKSNTWIVAPASESLIFHADHHFLWKKVMHSLGGKYSELANAPLSPMLN